MYVITMTGGLGAGKSRAAEFFREKGAVVIDLDTVAKRHIGPGFKAFGQLVSVFGEDIVGDNGSIDTDRLAERAFASPDCAQRLNDIVHPFVASEVLPSLTDLRLLPFPPPVVVLEVPLLVEAPVYVEVADVVLAIVAAEDVRVQRLAGKMSPEDARRRIACQASDDERVQLADHVIVNEGSEEEFLSGLERFWDEVVSANVA